MRRVFLLSILILLMSSALFGAVTDTRVWFYNGEHMTTFDLGRLSGFYVPNYETIYGKDSVQDGTYDRTKNGIGNAGYAFSNHDMTLTITPEYDSKFISQSDPTKYRSYYIAVVPRYRSHTGAPDDTTYTYDFFLNSNHAGSERVPNTKDYNSLTVKGPRFTLIRDAYTTVSDYIAILDNAGLPEGVTTDEQKLAYYKEKIAANMARMSNKSLTTATDLNSLVTNDSISMMRFWWDVLICFDPLNSDDLTHLTSSDDYIARIRYEWSCSEVGCTNPNHSLTGYIELRGYYEDNNHADDKVFIVITPDARASRLNLDGMIRNSREEVISTISISSPMAKNGESTYAKHVKFFVSASNHYNDNSNTFELKQYYNSTGHVTNGKTIQYTVKIYDNQDNLLKRQDNSNAVYDGTEAYTGKNTQASLEAALKLYWKENNKYKGYLVEQIEKMGGATQQLRYDGYATISLIVPDDYFIIDNETTISNPAYSGLYKSYVYYHVVWED